MHRPFVVFASVLSVRRTHSELPGRNDNHLWTIGAITKDCPRLPRSLPPRLSGSNRQQDCQVNAHTPLMRFLEVYSAAP